MSRTLCIYNNAGGVGKTTISINLAFYCQRQLGRKVLLIDSDAQSTCDPLLPKGRKKAGLGALMAKGSSVRWVSGTHWGFHMLPAGENLKDVFLKCGDKEEAARDYFQNLKRAILNFSIIYDYVIIDCEPGLTSIIPRFMMGLSDFVLVPVVPSVKKSIDGAERVFNRKDEGWIKGEIGTVINQSNPLKRDFEMELPNVYGSIQFSDRDILDLPFVSLENPDLRMIIRSMRDAE